MSTFADHVIAWQRVHGRHDLPWQRTRDPYAIWVSEIMLQQTQVGTVVPYYSRFMARFPDVRALAAAEPDDVLAHWSGLGYYSRARNLHGAARMVCERHGGAFPRDIESVVALPGIGRSTAAAILVFSCGQRHAILDGNVKRVLARCFAIPGRAADPAVMRSYWEKAEALLPGAGVEAYTQGLMDLGAGICVRRAPRCGECPLAGQCKAREAQAVHLYPAPRERRPVPRRATRMIVLQRGGEVLLEKRPAPGIWGGLWCFPEIAADDDAVAAAASRLGVDAVLRETMPSMDHAFTHFTLTITPERLEVERSGAAAHEPGRRWWPLDAVTSAPVPVPVRRILALLDGAAWPARGAS